MKKLTAGKRVQVGWTWITSSGYRTLSAKQPRQKSLRDQARPVYMFEQHESEGATNE